MVWAGLCYGQRTQVYFIEGILNAQRYRDKILRPIVVPFIHDHHLMLQHDNAQPHVARICTQFLEAENIPVLAWTAYSVDMSPIEHVWDALDRHIRRHVPVPANIQQLRRAIEEESTNILQAIHPSSSALSGAGSRGQLPEQEHPDFPLPGHFFQLFREDPKAFPGQPSNIVTPACPGSSSES